MREFSLGLLLTLSLRGIEVGLAVPSVAWTLRPEDLRVEDTEAASEEVRRCVLRELFNQGKQLTNASSCAHTSRLIFSIDLPG